jgi:hypothetical protein
MISPISALKERLQMFRDEFTHGPVHVTVGQITLHVGVKPMRHHKIELIPGPSHGYVQQPALLFEVVGPIQRNAAVHDI